MCHLLLFPQNINLFMETSEEEFAKFLQTFVADVWGLLMKVSLKPGQVGRGEGKSAAIIKFRADSEPM